MNAPAARPPGRTVAVAFSGGRDSLALLHATLRTASEVGLDVVALHVHHGLQTDADQWLASAQALCARWSRRGWPLRLRWHRLSGRPAAGDSVEAWARRERYSALARMAAEEGAGLVLLAQHLRDQAETVLLQALRGAGPRGVAAMPRMAEREGILWARPWLDRSRQAIDAYIQRYRLRPIEDPSNQNLRWARNRLRLQVWPALLASFPDAEQALAAAAQRAAEAAGALAELAALDLATIADGDALSLPTWQHLSAERRALALRSWLGQRLAAGVPESLVQRLLHELPSARNGRWPADGTGQLVAYRGRLRWTAGAQARETVIDELRIDLSRPGHHPVPDWHGAFEVIETVTGGIDATVLADAALRPRQGGEKFQRATGTPARSLKKQYQLAGMPAHERMAPLVWHGDRLLFVPGLGVDARAQAEAGRPQCALRWVLHCNS